MPLRKNIHRTKLKKHEETLEQVKLKTRQLTKTGKPWRHDWIAIKERFVTARPQITYAEVAEEFSLSVQMVSNRAAKEKWKHERANHQLTIAKDLRREYSTNAALKGIKFDEVAGDTATMGMNIVTARLLEVSRMVAARGNQMDEVIDLMRRGLPVPKEMTYFPVRSSELVQLAQAAQIFQDVGRKALGTDIQHLEATLEVTGSIEQVVSIGGELQKDNPERLADFLEVLHRMGVMNEAGETIEGDVIPEDEVEDALVKEIEGKVVEQEV